MSQDTKGRTMIGVMAPVIPRTVPPTGPQPPAAGFEPPPTGATPPAAAPVGIPPDAPTMMSFPGGPPAPVAAPMMPPPGVPAVMSPPPMTPYGHMAAMTGPAAGPMPGPGAMMTGPGAMMTGPGAMAPADMAPPNGAAPSGMLPAMPPHGAMPSAMLPPNGAMPSGMLPAMPPNGAMPSGMLPAMPPPGAMPSAMLPPNGAMPSGMLPAMPPHGAMPSAMLPPHGAMPSAMLPPPGYAPPPSAPAAGFDLRPAPASTDGFSGGSDADRFLGQELCGYTIRRKLAEGGMGVVYEGVHSKIGRLGAIKVLKLEFCRADDVVERFYQEARAVNSIRHENIVDVYDFGRDPQGRVFFVMEYLEGEPLSARLRRGALSWAEAFPILDQTLRALKAAHDKGFVHRDLKPDNIWLKYVDGRIQVKLLDFGIAKLVGTDSPRDKLTRTGSVIGTPHYMSPEQINGASAVDHRSDIYALGVIVYEMFTGTTPFVGDTLQAIMTGHLFKEPPRLADIPGSLGVPRPIADVVDRMLVKDASGRYDSAADVLADLHDVHGNRPPARAETLRRTRPIRGPAQGASSPRKRWRGAIAGSLAAAAIAGGAALVWQSRREAPPQVAAVAAPPRPVEPAPPPAARPIDHDAVRKDAQAVLRAALRETEPTVRVHGSDALGKVKDRPSIAPLSQLTEADPDAEVRGHAAGALGAIGAAEAAQLLGKLETAAPEPLKVWYASALAQLGDKAAIQRLRRYARSADLAVSFKAGLGLADVSPPGDQDAIAALRALAAREAELNRVAPYAGAQLLTKLVQLRDPSARAVLYKLLEHTDEGARLAAAEGLARLGDDAGKQVLHDVFTNPASRNQLVAAVAQIPLGEYGGLPLITQQLAAKDPGTRQLAARALGDISERASLPALIALTRDSDWTVRIAAATAIVAIVGLDPQVLAQASVDWTKGALASQDWAVRKAAAGVLADIPEAQAVPLLAQAIADPDRKVRLAASTSAGKMKTADAANQVVAAVVKESDPEVKEQQVKALGEIGNAVAHDTLKQLTRAPGRLGVFAAGSLIAVGDTSGVDQLDAAAKAGPQELRLAAMQAASTARNPIVVPTLKAGLGDGVFGIRFAAAEGLSVFKAEKLAAVKVLREGLAAKDPPVIGRALAALARLGEAARDARSPAELLDSADPRQRLTVVPIVRALPPGEGVPLLRRLVADPDTEVRHAGVDAIEDVAARDKDQAIKLYKPLVSDADPVVRAKAAGQLARLVPPPPRIAQPQAAPPPDDKLGKVQFAVDGATAAAAEARTRTDRVAELAAEVAAATAAPARDDAAIKHVEELARQLDDALPQLDAAAARVEAAASATRDAAGSGPSDAAARLVTDADQLARQAREAATRAREQASDAARKAREYARTETGDPQMFIAAADTAIAVGNVSDARQNLDKAARLLRQSGTRNPSLDFAYGRLYDQMASSTQNPAARLKLLQQAEDAYRRFAKAGAGPRVQRTNDRLTELADEIKALSAK